VESHHLRSEVRVGEDASGVAKDNGRQENPDTPDKEEEAEAIAEAQWTSIRQGLCCLLLLCCTSFLPWFLPPPPLRRRYALRRALVQLHRRPW
jgi:hypothetical protein